MHIFFDFDGTLVDITERWWQLHRDVASAFGLPHCTDREEYISQKRSGRREVDIMKKISDNDEGIQVYCRERVKRIELPKYLCYDTLFDDTVPTLRSLRSQGHEVRIVAPGDGGDGDGKDDGRMGQEKLHHIVPARPRASR